MSQYVNVRRFHKPLQEAGLVPEHCRTVEMTIGIDGAFMLRYEVFLTAEQIIALGEIFQRVGAETSEGVKP